MNYFVQGLGERETALALDRDSGTQFLEIVEECQDLEMFFVKSALLSQLSQGHTLVVFKASFPCFENPVIIDALTFFNKLKTIRTNKYAISK